MPHFEHGTYALASNLLLVNAVHVNKARRSRAITLQDLAQVPGNRLEPLAGDRKGQYSIRINDQYRVCFGWKTGDAYDVEIADYH